MKARMALMIGVILTLSLGGCSHSNRNLAPADPTSSLESDRRRELLSRARAARDAGRVVESLDYYHRALALDPAESPVEAAEIMQVFDGLRLEIQSGDRQAAGPGRPPRSPLQVGAVLELVEHGAKHSVPATGVPITWKWSSPDEGAVQGERSTDANGRATVTVDSMPSSPDATLRVAVDVIRMPSFRDRDPALMRLAEEAAASLRQREAVFSFIGQRPGTKNRVIILIDETLFGRQVDQSLVSDRLTSTMVDAGMKVVGITEMGRSDYDKLRMSFNPDEWVALRPKLMKLCDFVVYGHIDVRQDYENRGGGKWCVGKGRVSLYGTYTPEIEASVDFSDVAEFSGDTWENGGERCLRTCANRTVEKLVPLVLRKTAQ